MKDDLVSAMRNNVAQKQILIDKLVEENVRLWEFINKLKQEEKNDDLSIT